MSARMIVNPVSMRMEKRKDQRPADKTAGAGIILYRQKENKIERMAVKAMRIQRLTKDAKENLLEDLLKRSPNNYGQYEQGVQEILAHVKEEKDQAVFAYTKKFDHADITADNIKVTEEEIEEAYKEVDPKLVEIIRKALLNIRTYHEKQRQYSWFDSKPDGTILGQKVTALDRVGVYVPGGKAAYPSSVLMNIVPAKNSGSKRNHNGYSARKRRKSNSHHTCCGKRSRSG